MSVSIEITKSSINISLMCDIYEWCTGWLKHFYQVHDSIPITFHFVPASQWLAHTKGALESFEV